MKYIFLKLFIIIAIVIIGCGVHVTEEKTVYIPEKISVEIPKLLIEPSDQQNNYYKRSKQEKIFVEPEGFNSEGYKHLNDNLYLLDAIINDIKFHIYLENTVMPKIQFLCKDTPLNQVCTLPANSVELNVSENLVTVYDTFYPDELRIDENIVGKTIPFGKIEFVKYDKNQIYQFAMNVNLTEIERRLYAKEYIFEEDELKNFIQNVQWSEDNQTVFSSLSNSFKGEKDTYPWTIHYQNEPNSAENMHIFHRESSTAPQILSSTYNFDLKTKYDENKTTTFALNDIYERFLYNQPYQYALSSYGQANKFIGFERYSLTQFDDEYGDTKHREDEIFDLNGTSIARTYCSQSSYRYEGYEAETCELSDPKTWYIDTKDESLFEPFKQIEFNELQITKGNLTNGEYFLMASDFNSTNPTAQDVLKERVGSFVVIEEKRQGAIYDKTFINKLNSLQILYANYNENLKVPLEQRDTKLFKVIKGENRPILTLYP